MHQKHQGYQYQQGHHQQQQHYVYQQTQGYTPITRPNYSHYPNINVNTNNVNGNVNMYGNVNGFANVHNNFNKFNNYAQNYNYPQTNNYPPKYSSNHHQLVQEQSSFQLNRNPHNNKVSLKGARGYNAQLINQLERQKQKSTTTYYSNPYQSPATNNFSTKITTNTQTSSPSVPAININPHTSNKNLLPLQSPSPNTIDTVASRSRNGASDTYISMTYEDIRFYVKTKDKGEGGFLDTLLCGLNMKNISEDGCQCGQTCQWMDHWLSLSMKNILYEPKTLRPIPKQLEQQIRKDLKRTQPTSKTFENPKHQQLLYQCLVCYAKVDPQIGYIQGMNIICSVLLYHSLDVNKTIQVMKFLMITCNYRRVYLNDFEYVHKLSDYLLQVLKYRCYDLYHHLVQTHSISLNIFIIGWVLPMLGNLVPLKQMHFVVNTFIQKSWQGIMKIIISLMLYLRPYIIENHDQTELMQMLSIQGLKKRIIPWEEVIVSGKNVKMGGFRL